MKEHFNYNREFLINYFGIKHPSDVRILSICCIITINFLGIGPLAAALTNINRGLFNSQYGYLLYPIFAISVWGIIVAIFPYKLKLQFFLFVGAASLVITVHLVISYIIIVCAAYGLPPVIFAAIGILAPLCAIVIRTAYRVKLFREKIYPKRGKPLYGIISAFSLFGLAFGKILFPNINKKAEDLLFAFLLLLLACIFGTLIELIYRYFLSLKYKKML